MATPLPSPSTLAAAPTSAVTALATTPSPAASVCTFGGDARRAPSASADDGALRGPAPTPMLTLPLPMYGANLVANIGANGPLAVALGLCLLRRVDPGVLAAADATGTNKLLLAATTVAMKAHFDDFYVNKYMARIGGLETAKELGELEAHMFLTLLGGRAQVSPGEVGHRDRQQRDGSSSGSLQGIVQWREGVDSDATPLPEPGETPRSAAPPLVVADDHEQASRSPSPLPVPIAADVISQTPRHHRGPRRRAQRRLTVPAAEQRRLPLTQPSLLGTTPHEAPRPPLLNHGEIGRAHV